ncbi:PREDICTED: uncharacterized protein LOC109155371 [Ipomoea nil]|uniref:uncharacterized protein LOC109155371 n=1 Tax=Ipomoea nil TaxID=35883 RepID=UPI000900F714|nr:PREDICTED: uncharacterized protein LOC109155371 [Ipomoea nil]
MGEKGEAALCSTDQEEERPALGLKLKKSPSFINEIERKLSQPWNNNDDDGAAENHPPPPQMNSSTDFMSQPMSEKLKASNFSAAMLRIGEFERVSRHESDLVAKLYYAKRKLVWEFLEGPLKKKIEIQWSDIGAMRATIEDGQPGLWEIELNQPPLFFHETNPQPRKHTLWQPVGDFTNGQASRVRRHLVKFPRGVLDKHYEKLLQCDPRLHMLSQQPFPIQNPNMFFVHQPTNSSYEVSDLCLDFQRHSMPNILTHPNPYHHHHHHLTFPAATASHMNMNIIPHHQNNNYNWLLHATMLPPPNNIVLNEAQSSLADHTLVYPTHEYPMNNHHHHMIDNHQVLSYNSHQTMVVGGGNNNFDDPNMDALRSFYHRNNFQNNNNNNVVVSNGLQAMETTHNHHHYVAQGGTLYHGSSPNNWVSSSHHHFTNGDHSPAAVAAACSTGDSASPNARMYPNQDYFRRHDTQD